MWAATGRSVSIRLGLIEGQCPPRQGLRITWYANEGIPIEDGTTASVRIVAFKERTPREFWVVTFDVI